MHGYTVTIDLKGLPNKVSIDKVTLASDATMQVERSAKAEDHPFVGHIEKSSKYTVKKIVAHRRANNKNLNKMGWYEYAPEDDIWEPADYIPQHFFARYHERQRHTQPTTKRL